MLRGLTLVAVLGSVAIAVGYVISKGSDKTDESPFQQLFRYQPIADSQITIVSYPVGISFKRSAFISSQEMVHKQLDEILRDPFKITPNNQNGNFKANVAKRSMAIGRTGWRPGKRSKEESSKGSAADNRIFWLPADHRDTSTVQLKNEEQRGQPEQVYEEAAHPNFEQKQSEGQKRSLAIGRAQWRPGKRAIPISSPDFPTDFGDSPFYAGSGHDFIDE